MADEKRLIRGERAMAPARSQSLSQNQGIAVVAIAGLGLLGFLVYKLWKKSPQPASALARPFILADRTYTNAEEWEIEWNKDGLPKKVTIHRRASRK